MVASIVIDFFATATPVPAYLSKRRWPRHSIQTSVQPAMPYPPLCEVCPVAIPGGPCDILVHGERSPHCTSPALLIHHSVRASTTTLASDCERLPDRPCARLPGPQSTFGSKVFPPLPLLP